MSVQVPRDRDDDLGAGGAASGAAGGVAGGAAGGVAGGAAGGMRDKTDRRGKSSP